MRTYYSQFAGRSVDRVCALSDGIFGVAMTLLVLDLHVPSRQAVHTDAQLWTALAALAPQLATYIMSLLTLGIFWLGQQAQLNLLERGDRHLTWIHIAFLFAVVLMPFSTRLLSEFIDFRSSLLWYWANIFLLGLMLSVSWLCATRRALVKAEATPEAIRAIFRRIYIAQGVYAFGALLCLFNNYASIGFIVAAQVVFAISPNRGFFSRL
jgi:hypothetical protein